MAILAHELSQLIGNTPLVKLKRIPERGSGTIWGKCEFLNPGGSVKDRIALAMVESAEREGKIKPGSTTLVEPTSGNTGIGLALVSAIKGYRLVLTMPENMSLERRNLLTAYGAEIVLTPEDRTMEGAVAVAQELCRKPNHVMLMQFENPANPAAHRTSTGPEIIEQMEGQRVDGFVAGVGTGGTITGVGEALRERYPGVRIIAVEPDRSPVLSGGEAGPHKIQGIGAGFIPRVLNRSIYDSITRVRDEDAYLTKQRLAREEGLLVGISAGANVFVASQLARELGPNANVVCVLCDTGERYFSLDHYFADVTGAAAKPA